MKEKYKVHTGGWMKNHNRNPKGWDSHKNENKRFQKAFTLVEIMVVVVVIGIIAGLVLAAAGGVQKKAARDQAKAEIKTMAIALERYKADRITYPGFTNPSQTALFTNLTNYMTFKTSQVTNNQVLDPYGYPYWYRSPAAASSTMLSESFEIWSVGANGKSGLTNQTPNLGDTNNLDDITSWQ
jgi:general secretion pathway protein G